MTLLLILTWKKLLLRLANENIWYFMDNKINEFFFWNEFIVS